MSFRIVLCLLGCLFVSLCENCSIQRSRTNPYNPQGNGVGKRFKPTLHGLFRALSRKKKESGYSISKKWWVFFYNATPHKTTGESPFFMLFGREPLLPLDLQIQKSIPSTSEYLSLLLVRLRKVHQLALARTDCR